MGDQNSGVREGYARPVYAFVVSSSCQMYSGTGVAIFDFAEAIRDEYHVALVMDVGNPMNVGIAHRRCRALGVEFVASRTGRIPSAPDNGVVEAVSWVAQHRPQVVELVSWASALTNSAALAIKNLGAELVFTPHLQPIWTLPNASTYTAVMPILRKTFLMADLVCADSSVERNAILNIAPECRRVMVSDLGIKTEAPPVGEPRRRRVVSIADFAEHRKRPELLVRVLEEVATLDSHVTFALIGRNSERVHLPKILEGRCDVLGYVDEATKARELSSSSVFLSVSNFEAFGIPIAEALGAGLQAVLCHTDVVDELFGHMPGVTISRNDDPRLLAQSVLAALDAPVTAEDVAQAAQSRFGFPNVYDNKRHEVRNVMNESKHG